MDKMSKGFVPTITDPLQFRLLGCEFYGDPFLNSEEWSYENQIGTLWKRFGKLAQKYEFILEKLNVKPNFAYEIHIEPAEYAKTRQYYVFVGIEIDYFDEIPLEMVIKQLPLTQYVEFTTTMAERKTEYIFQDWLISEESEYCQSYPYVIQQYGPMYKGLEDPTSEIEWLIPVKKR